MSNTIETRQAALKDMMHDTRYLNIVDAPELSDFDNADDLREYIQERIYEHEVIYYTVAMGYLMENDPSLTESLELAHDMGYTCKEPLNSEILATLHMQQAMSVELYELDLDDLFTDEDDESEQYAEDMAEQINETEEE